MAVPDRTKINFFTGDPVDKIVYETPTPLSIDNDGITNNAPQSCKIVDLVIPNPYGKKALCRFVYSVDGGVSYNGQDAHLAYTYAINTIPPLPPFGTTLGGLLAAVSVGVTADSIRIRTGNGYHGNVSDNGVNYFYTANPLTFLVKLALFEVQ